jgi:thiosulfate/3-mercaptopyruvate sulfurtransferase
MRSNALAAVLLFLPGALLAQNPRAAVLVAPADVQLDDPQLVLLHVGDTTEYKAAHIPGARLLELRTLSAPRTSPEDLVLQMPEPAALKTALEALGISDDSRIVIYMGKDWVTPTARAVYTLDYAGFGERTRLLDGGLPAWQAAGRPVTADVPAPHTGRIAALRIRADRIVDKAWVEAHRQDRGITLIDARSQSSYDGVQADQGRNGHIPGAASVPWASLYDEESARLKSADELRAVFAAAGFEPGDTVVGYCHIGQYATAMLFAARSLGYDIRLFDGSFQEWARDPASPVEAKKSPRP